MNKRRLRILALGASGFVACIGLSYLCAVCAVVGGRVSADEQARMPAYLAAGYSYLLLLGGALAVVFAVAAIACVTAAGISATEASDHA
jgi:Mn2+/Fe2+ NRAMP family transporter